MDGEQIVRELWGRMIGHLGYEADFASDAVSSICIRE
jgi:hypothetical protein